MENSLRDVEAKFSLKDPPQFYYKVFAELKRLKTCIHKLKTFLGIQRPYMDVFCERNIHHGTRMLSSEVLCCNTASVKEKYKIDLLEGRSSF